MDSAVPVTVIKDVTQPGLRTNLELKLERLELKPELDSLELKPELDRIRHMTQLV